MSKKPHNVSMREKNNYEPVKKDIVSNVENTVKKPEVERDSSWEQLNNIYAVLAQAIVNISNEVNNVVSHENFISALNDKQESFIILKGFKRDIETLTNDLIGIKALHRNRQGIIQSEVDLIDSLNIYDNYINFQNRFDSCIAPILNILTDINLNIELNKLEAKEEQLKATTDIKE